MSTENDYIKFAPLHLSFSKKWGRERFEKNVHLIGLVMINKRFARH